jgi:TonB family protein
MRVRYLMLVAGLLAAAPALSQTAEQRAQNASTWDVFMKLYPKRALQAHEEGPVGFKVTLDNKGDVVGCQVTKSSGHPLLDDETCKLVTLNAVFKPDPNLGPSQTKTSEGVINWKLPDSKGVAAVSPTAFADGSAPEKVVCKKTLRTGTLAGYERTCMTPTEWAKQSDAMKADWEDMQGKKGSTHGN